MAFDEDPSSPVAPEEEPAALEEASAWETVLNHWTDESVHRAYLARFADLAGLARAGRRYREALLRSPSDAVAIRFRDEIVKRATVQGLALLPRSAPPRALPPWAKMALAVLFGLLSAAVAYKIFDLFFCERPEGILP